MNRKAAEEFYYLTNTLSLKVNVNTKPQLICNVGESGFPLNNRPSKIVAENGRRNVVAISSVTRGENVTAVIGCNAAVSYITPLIMFKHNSNILEHSLYIISNKC